MTYMDIKPKAEDRVAEFEQWLNNMQTVFLTTPYSDRINIPVKYSVEVKYEPSEVTLSRSHSYFNGVYTKELKRVPTKVTSLHIAQDTCELCGEAFTANCNNGNCS